MNSISELPQIPTNMQLHIQEQTNMTPPDINSLHQTPPIQTNPQPSFGEGRMDSDTINKLIAGIQNASLTGITSLPIRDVPRDTSHLINDNQANVEFIPQPPPQPQPQYQPQMNMNERHYNDNDLDILSQKLLEKQLKNNNNSSNVDMLYDEFNIPIVVFLLFFIFQLPFYKKYLMLYLPFLFYEDHNYNIYGFLFSSTIFAFIYYLLTCGIKKIYKY